MAWSYANPIGVARRNRRLSARKLAKKARLAIGTVMSAENGRRRTTITSISKLATALRVPFHVLAQVYFAWWELRPIDEPIPETSDGSVGWEQPDSEEARRPRPESG